MLRRNLSRETAKLVSDDIVIALIEEQLRLEATRAGAIFDGFPRTLAQAQAELRFVEQLRQSSGDEDVLP